MDAFAKLLEIVNQVKAELNFTDEAIFQMTQKLANKWHYKQTKNVELTKEEATLYEYFLNKGHNPSTLYKWMLLYHNAPEEIKQNLVRGNIRITSAKKIVKEYKDLNQISQEQFIKIIADSINRYVMR